MKYEEFSAKIKEKHPEYSQVPDYDLAVRMLTKFPQYKEAIDMSSLRNPRKANATLGGGIKRNLTPEQTSALSSVMDEDAWEKELFRAYSEQKHGQRFNDVMLDQQREFEYPGQSFKFANTENKRALKWEKATKSDIAKTAGQSVVDAFGNVARDWIQAGLQYMFGGDLVAYARSPKQQEAVAELAERDVPITTEEFRPVASGFAKRVGAAVKDIAPEEWKEAQETVRSESGESGVNFFKLGFMMVADNAGNLIAGMTNPLASYQVMFSSERNSMEEQMIGGGIDPLIANDYSAIYGSASAPIEFLEIRGRLGSMMSGKVISKLKTAGINVGQELLQDLIGKVVYNEAVDAHFKKTGEQLEKQEILDIDGNVITGSLSMSVIMEAMGLSVKGASKARQVAMTLGDARRINQQKTFEEIEQMDLTLQEKEAIHNPTVETVEEANRSRFEAEEIEPLQMPEEGEIKEQGKVEGQQQERVPPAGEQQRAQEPGSTEEVQKENKITVYHTKWSNTETGKKFGGIHVGTKEAGSQRADSVYQSEKSRIGPIKAKELLGKKVVESYQIDKSKIYMADTPMNEQSGEYKILEIPDSKERQALIDQGYNGVAYTNVKEDAGSVSYLLFEKPTTQQAPTQEAPKQAPLQDGGTVGVSKAWDSVENNLEFDESVLAPERVRQTETIKSAFNKGLHTKTDAIIEKVKKKRAITHEEVGALLIRKTEIINEIDSIKKQMEQARKDGNEELLSSLGEELALQKDLGVEITETARRGATEVARSLAAMAMNMDKKTFDLVSVRSEAIMTKGENLTAEEDASLEVKVDELKEVDDDLANIPYPTPSAMLNRMMIIDEVERAYRRIKKPSKKRIDKNKDIKLIRKRQDDIFAIIDEINNGKPKTEHIRKEQDPDSEGYLEMINTLRKELVEIRKSRKLDEQIAQLEADLVAGNISKYDIKKTLEFESQEIMQKRARKLALQKEINRQIADLKPKSLASIASGTWDIFRNIRLTADAGHLLRQGGIVMSNPKMWKGNIQQFYRESMKALLKENADVLDATIMAHKNYEKWKLAGLAMIEEGQQLDAREEILMNGLLGKVPGVGTAQQAFGRMQISGTNLLRLLTAESYLASNPDATLAEMKDMAKAVNVLTGRGNTAWINPKLNTVLNKILTSPSFTASRFQAPILLTMKGSNGKPLWKNKQIRNRVIQDSAWFVGTRMAIMAMIAAALPDAEIGDDPDHWTYGRLIVDVGGGKTRVYDPWAGVISAYRSLYPITEGEIGTSLGKVFEGRKHPALSSAIEIGFGKTYYGEEIDRRTAFVRSLLPISVEGMKEAIKEDTGIIDLLSSVSTDVMGIGSTLVETSDLRKSRQKAKKNN